MAVNLNYKIASEHWKLLKNIIMYRKYYYCQVDVLSSG